MCTGPCFVFSFLNHALYKFSAFSYTLVQLPDAAWILKQSPGADSKPIPRPLQAAGSVTDEFLDEKKMKKCLPSAWVRLRRLRRAERLKRVLYVMSSVF